LLGYSEQAFHKAERHQVAAQVRQTDLELLMKETINDIRQRMPRIGGEKLWIMTAEKLTSAGLEIGRDKFVSLYTELGFAVKKRKKRRKTTDSSAWQRQYEDLRKVLIPTRPEELVVADITYIETENGDAYMPLITDAYSKLILGYEVAHRMRAEECLVALNMAIKNRQYEGICIHHSDRGSQYISAEYTNILHNSSFISSTTQDGSPYDNAVAERINRIVKEEFGFDGVTKKFKNAKEAKALMKKAVDIYNKERPHMSNHMLTPFQMHKQDKLPIKKWGKSFANKKSTEQSE
jgi:putative transposase